MKNEASQTSPGHEILYVCTIAFVLLLVSLGAICLYFPDVVRAFWPDDWTFGAQEAKLRQEDAAEALGVPRQLTIELPGGEKMRLVLIPAGEFVMGGRTPPGELEEQYGDDANLLADEHPRHRVRITKPFYMGVTEVTADQMAAYRRAQRLKSEGKVGPQQDNPFDFEITDDRPATLVTWTDAHDFCQWVEESTGDKARLPTEAEWEYACRAGTATAYYFGDDPAKLDDYAWYEGNSDYRRHPVGEKKPNPWGLHDMSGNVWEWCHDWYWEDYYAASRVKDPQGPSASYYIVEGDISEDELKEGKIGEIMKEKLGSPPFDDQTTGRVVRGGAYDKLPGYCRSAARNAFSEGREEPNIGFRLVVSAVAGNQPARAQ